MSTAVVSPGPAAALVNAKLAVVLCKVKGNASEPHGAAYYRDLFSETGKGKGGAYDYWKDVSYGALDLTGTTVAGGRWYDMDQTADELSQQSLPDGGRLKIVADCAAKAAGDVRFADFAGIVVVTNADIAGNLLFGGRSEITIAGTPYADRGWMLTADSSQLAGILHESGHAFALRHSRTLSQQMSGATTQSDYGDFLDVMSCEGCYGAPGIKGNGPPGLNAVQLDSAQWIPAAREVRDFDNSTCAQRTMTLAALNHPEAAGFLEARIPAAVAINHATESTVTDYYTLEFRERSGWDAGIRLDGVVIHLHGNDGRSYLVDRSGLAGTYVATPRTPFDFIPVPGAGSQYVDPSRRTYVAVNRVDVGAHTAVVTVGGCRITPSIAYRGPIVADTTDTAALAADLTVAGAPVPSASIRLGLGTQSCVALTDPSGRAACTLRVDQPAGPVTASATFAGDAAYEAATARAPFTINPEATIVYQGATRLANGEPVTLGARLREVDGEPVAGRAVAMTVGDGPTAQGCTPVPVTSAGGLALCTLTPAQPLGGAGTVPVSTAFAGDDYFLPSSASSTATLQYLTGRASGLGAALDVLGARLGLAATPDTGDVRTAAASRTSTPCVVSASVAGLLSAQQVCAGVTTSLAPGSSNATASVASATVAVPGAPVIVVMGVAATATQSCTMSSLTTAIAGLTIGGASIDVSRIAPNTTIRSGVVTVVLSEQARTSGPGFQRGSVTAVHVLVNGLLARADVVLGSAAADVHNCI